MRHIIFFSSFQGEIDSEIVPVKKGKDHYWTNLTLPDSFEMFAFGISVDAYMKKTGRFISSGIRWNQCAYAVDAGKTLHLNMRHVDSILISLHFKKSCFVVWLILDSGS